MNLTNIDIVTLPEADLSSHVRRLFPQWREEAIFESSASNYVPDQMRMEYGVLYDRVWGPSPLPNLIQFFAHSYREDGRTQADTCLRAPNCVPPPEAFWLMQARLIEMKAPPGWREGRTLTFRLGRRECFQVPLWSLPEGAAVVDLSEQGLDSTCIENNMDFGWELAAPERNHGPEGAWSLGLVLYGLHVKPLS